MMLIYVLKSIMCKEKLKRQQEQTVRHQSSWSPLQISVLVPFTCFTSYKMWSRKSWELMFALLGVALLG